MCDDVGEKMSLARAELRSEEDHTELTEAIKKAIREACNHFLGESSTLTQDQIKTSLRAAGWPVIDEDMELSEDGTYYRIKVRALPRWIEVKLNSSFNSGTD